MKDMSLNLLRNQINYGIEANNYTTFQRNGIRSEWIENINTLEVAIIRKLFCCYVFNTIMKKNQTNKNFIKLKLKQKTKTLS